MSQRPSVSSNSPFLSSATHTHGASPSARNLPTTFSQPSDIYPNGHSSVDSDDLFTKYTVQEVKAVQQQLRADAEAKQEELRLMVGERYRDLLQASTSIISLSQSSKRISESLNEVHEIVLSQKESSMPKRTSSTVDDKHLHSLQSLAAHIKLLLDTPEHLWRFIEQKKYLHAAWLFLLARVVYRALVQTEDQDDASWREERIDILSEFPLAERQWDIISQFRSQIIHKATLSLREVDTSPEDVCSTLVTLHLLDSRPLIETFSTLISQRSKALQVALHQPPDQDSKNLHNHPSIVVSNVKKAVANAVIVISRTIGTSRTLFSDGSSTPSMIKQVLNFIHSDLVESSSLSPSDLHLTSRDLLASFMTSNQLSLLPPSLMMYKPYVDLKSSSLFSALTLSQKLDTWLRDSIEIFQGCAREWLRHATSVKAVWHIRTSTCQLLQKSEMSEAEKMQLLSVLDSLCQERIINIWETLLIESSKNFGERLSEALSSLEGGISIETASADLFSMPAPPSSPFVSSPTVSEDATFQTYASVLRKKLVGRTPLIDSIITCLEQCARTVQQDLFDISKVDDESTSKLLKILISNHRPSADTASTNVLESVSALVQSIEQDQRFAIDKLGFLASIAAELYSSSSVISRIGFGDEGIHEFKRRGIAIYNLVIERWLSLVVEKCIAKVSPAYESNTASPVVSRPSSQLIQALVALCRSIMQLELCRDHALRQELTLGCLSTFAANWTKKVGSRNKQSMMDILFLHKLLGMQKLPSTETLESLNSLIGPDVWSTDERETAENAVAAFLSRTQILFASLLPGVSETGRGHDKSTFRIMQVDTPVKDDSAESALDLATPNSRFGLLLVASS